MMPPSSTQGYPVVTLIDSLIAQAIEAGASDIHFEPQPSALVVRQRLDGILHPLYSIELAAMPQAIARLKVLANLNSAQQRIPQDGQFTLTHCKLPIDVRVSTFPCLGGEKIVVRLLNRTQYALALDKIGLPETIYEHTHGLLRKSSGFFLVAGPTGSGKTTTLYAALTTLNRQQLHIITLEDPVEYQVPDITQGQINNDTGFTFERGIRALLRQDPDVVMIGEIRDKQTARIAIEAALTGHLVFSTVHTTDAPSVIMRLMDMGIEPYLINAALSGVLAQRLARRICAACKQPVEPDAQHQRILQRINVDLSTIYRGSGCVACNHTGYKGRIGIFEQLVMTSALRSLIVQHPSFDAVLNQACADGLQPLVADASRKVQQGIITLDELVRVCL